MKKLFTALILSVCTICIGAQNFNFGYNGNGFFENRTPATDQRVADIPGVVTLFIPGGPISKLADPIATPKGWGLDDARTNAFFSSGGTDEDGASVQKWLDKENVQPNRSYLLDCIDLNNSFPGEFAFNYRVNINAPADNAIAAIKTLIDGGCQVTGVIMGSEVYSWLNFDFEAYKAKFQPIAEQIHSTYPFMDIGLCVAPNPERGDHTKWNNSIANFVSQNLSDANVGNDYITAGDVHFYVGEKNCYDTWNTMPAKRVIKPGVDDTELTNYFSTAYDCLMSTTSIPDRIATYRALFPGLKLWCAEGFTTNPSAYFGNTWLGAAAQFKFIVESTLDITGKQTGVAPDIYGDQCRINDFDLVNEQMVTRTGYWASLLAREAIDAGAVELPDAPGWGAYYFYTKGGFNYTFSAPAGYEIKEVVVRRLTGQFLFSSAGGTQYHAKGSTPSYEIDGIEIDIFSKTMIIPPNSFGYAQVVIEKIPEPKCYCTDPTALNYNAEVDCADEKPCNYPPPPPTIDCRKRWFEFWKPKCTKK